jgi:hypothetical protein
MCVGLYKYPESRVESPVDVDAEVDEQTEPAVA